MASPLSARQLLFISMALSLLLATWASYRRAPWSDEGLFSSASYNLARHGYLGTTVIDPSAMHLTRINERTYWVMPLYLLGQAVWMKLFPATLFTARTYTLLWVPIALFSLYRFLCQITAKARASALAVSLFALSFIFLDNASFARPDLMCCALGLSGLAVFVEWRQKHFYLSLMVSNAFIAASGMTHPNGVFHLIALIALVIWYERRRLTPSAVGAAVLPYALFGLAWGLYVMQDYPAFIDQMRGNGTNGRWPSTWNPATILGDEIGRYLWAFGLVTRGWALLKLLALFAYITALAGALLQSGFRRQRSTQLVLSLIGLYFLGLTVFNQKVTSYLIHIVPWYCALLALYLDWLRERLPGSRVAVQLIVVVLVSVESAGMLMKTHKQSQTPAQEEAAIAFALANARPNDRIVGSAALIYGFAFDARLRDDPELGTNGGETPDLIIVDPVYRDLYAWSALADRPVWKVISQEKMLKINKQLSTYRLAYSNDACQVYLPGGGLLE